MPRSGPGEQAVSSVRLGQEEDIIPGVDARKTVALIHSQLHVPGSVPFGNKTGAGIGVAGVLMQVGLPPLISRAGLTFGFES